MTKEELKNFEKALKNMKEERKKVRNVQDFLDYHGFEVEEKSYNMKIEGFNYCICELEYVIDTAKIE